MPDPIIDVQNITVQIDRSSIISDVSFQVYENDFIGIIGPNGAGKSTLIRSILGLQPIKQGAISLWGTPIQTFHQWHKIGYTPQHMSINTNFPASVYEIIRLGLLSTLSFPRIFGAVEHQRIQTILTHLELTDIQHEQFSSLSGGQRQRTLLAKALVSQPRLLILDEPTNSLDTHITQIVYNYIATLSSDRNITVLLISHDPEAIEQYANTILAIDQTRQFFGPKSHYQFHRL